MAELAIVFFVENFSVGELSLTWILEFFLSCAVEQVGRETILSSKNVSFLVTELFVRAFRRVQPQHLIFEWVCARNLSVPLPVLILIGASRGHCDLNQVRLWLGLSLHLDYLLFNE